MDELDLYSVARLREAFRTMCGPSEDREARHVAAGEPRGRPGLLLLAAEAVRAAGALRPRRAPAGTPRRLRL